jgi:uncharacterized membrane protein
MGEPPPFDLPRSPAESSPWHLGWLGATDLATLLPPPAALQAYAAVHPDAIEKIMAWASAHTTHRHAPKRQTLERWTKFQARAQLLTAAVATVGLLSAGAVGIWGSPVAACIIAVAAVGGPATARALAHVLPADPTASRRLDEDGRHGDSH